MKSMELVRQELLWAIETGYIQVRDGKIRVENGKVVFTKSTNQTTCCGVGERPSPPGP